MYHAYVCRKVHRMFADLDDGNYEPAIASLAPRFEHVFAGEDHPLAGVRHSLPAMRAWFERLFRLNQALRFTVKRVVASGLPWDTTIVAEWRDSATLANGDSYVNDGVHVIRLRWGRVTSIHAYLDTEVFATACRRLAADGYAEAAAAPIED